jgi:hypothetical protein
VSAAVSSISGGDIYLFINVDASTRIAAPAAQRASQSHHGSRRAPANAPQHERETTMGISVSCPSQDGWRSTQFDSGYCHCLPRQRLVSHGSDKPLIQTRSG